MILYIYRNMTVQRLVAGSMRTLLVILVVSIHLLCQVRGTPGKHFLIETDDEAADDLGVTDTAADDEFANDKAVADTESAEAMDGGQGPDYHCVWPYTGPHC